MKKSRITDSRFSEPDAYDNEGNITLNSWELFMKEELLCDILEEEKNK